MEIGKEIKQTKDFKSQIEKALVNIHFTTSWLNAVNLEMLAPYDMSMQQYNILRILKGQSPKSVTVKFLIERMLDKSSNASRLVDKLYAKELVTRTQSPNDRRQVDVGISKKGIETLEEITTLMHHQFEKQININEEEAEVLSNLLDKLRG